MTERKRTNSGQLEETVRELRDSEERYRRLVELCPDGVFMQSEGVISFVNLAGSKLIGADRPQRLFGTPLLDLFHPDHRAAAGSRFQEAAAKGPTPPFEEKMVRLDGAVIDVEVAAAPFTVQGKPALQVMVRDITARKESEETLRRQAEFIRAIAESTGEGLYAIDRSGRVTFMNSAAEEMIGWSREELFLRDLHQMTHYRKPDGSAFPRHECPIIHAMENRTTIERDDVFIKKDGTMLSVALSAAPLRSAQGETVGAVVAFRDSTERRRLEEQLLHAQKLEAVGRLAGGIAHDFNNLLSVIAGYGELVLADIPEPGPARSRVLEILRATERATGLTRQLLAFGRKQVIEPRVLDLNATAQDVERMLRRLIGEDVDIHLKLAPDLGRIRADAGQIEQVIINLTVNARDAMPRGGKLTIETANVTLDEDAVRGYVDVKPGHYVRLCVSDTGVGMDRETREHLFEPFFTTKEPGKGTGLGLATVYGIVKQSGGHVWVYSEPGWGTTFKVYFPRYGDVAEPGRPALEAGPAPGGTETILVVEDDEMIRSLIRDILESTGYRVLVADDPDQGMKLIGEQQDEIHLLLTDLILPGMSGRELVDRVTKEKPEMRVLFMSGYSDEAVARHGILEPGLAFLQKPFSRDALVRKVRDVLDSAGSHIS
ncbi:MAG TPA: PAS domain S-box protein [Candidatus Eisenbacteria bacterium]|jgi:PAS domain S-box-containing protein|nr:PAS domain S-box protein [Candidatus Eisenbacteria bacterium]